MSEEIRYRKNGTMTAREARLFGEAADIAESCGQVHEVRRDLMPEYVRALAELWRQNERLRGAHRDVR